MDGKVLLVLCLVAGLVIGVNGLLVLSLTRGNVGQQFHLLRQAGRRAARPWGEEDEALAELSRRVAALQDPPATDETSAPG